jgi:hypothetical protein
LRIRGEAEKALHVLSSMSHITPDKFVERLLIQNWERIQDEALCKKEFFKSSAIFQLELPFCFPYECEKFELQLNANKVRFYLERIPKKNMDLLPFRTLATVIIQLKPEDEKIAKEKEQHIARDRISSRYLPIGYNTLKELIVSYRRTTGDYYNIGVIQQPVNLEAFKKAVRMSLVIDGQEYSSSRFMPIQEGSFISVKQGLDKQLHSNISSELRQLTEREHDFLSVPMDYYDAAMVFFYEEQWNLCLINSVVSMESAMAGLVFQTSACDYLMKMRDEDLKTLKKEYKEAVSLPKKIERFLFPLIKELHLVKIELNLKSIMPFVKNEKTVEGIYDLRSRILHEGVSIGKKKAKKALQISSQFLHVLQVVNQNVKFYKESAHDKSANIKLHKTRLRNT